jgi:hypothetical protein
MTAAGPGSPIRAPSLGGHRVGFRELQPDDAALVPGETEGAEGGVEQAVALL